MARKIWNVVYHDLKDDGTTSFSTKGKALKHAVEEIEDAIGMSLDRSYLDHDKEDLREVGRTRHGDPKYYLEFVPKMIRALEKKQYEKVVELFAKFNAESTGWTYIEVEESLVA